ncbi:hypothetical protein M569_12508 [Genlisea aurea]|uniref:RING-CH-type domain-containing protein n=1 Tax=Genlisea aurea TaxID=192259 RepID=S8C698_9LAMI|nr:hypothetical protein M569_12508 [Genlisea aurea]
MRAGYGLLGSEQIRSDSMDQSGVDLEAPSTKGEESDAGEEGRSRSVCRICHLDGKDSDESAAEELEEIGCGCRGELGIAHAKCSEAWFRNVRNLRGDGEERRSPVRKPGVDGRSVSSSESQQR